MTFEAFLPIVRDQKIRLYVSGVLNATCIASQLSYFAVRNVLHYEVVCVCTAKDDDALSVYIKEPDWMRRGC